MERFMLGSKRESKWGFVDFVAILDLNFGGFFTASAKETERDAGPAAAAAFFFLALPTVCQGGEPVLGGGPRPGRAAVVAELEDWKLPSGSALAMQATTAAFRRRSSSMSFSIDRTSSSSSESPICPAIGSDGRENNRPANANTEGTEQQEAETADCNFKHGVGLTRTDPERGPQR